jgi:exodeoxyribonuclease-3
MKIATWNINSVRLRKEIVLKLLKEENIDILCLQETKTNDENFPHNFFISNGYDEAHFSGEKSYNGVAIISKHSLQNRINLDFYNSDKRHISINFSHRDKQVELHNFYIPAGGDIPDVNENPKFLHKLEYCRLIDEWFRQNRNKNDNIIVVGDFNVAPYENDVWSHKQLLKVVSHTPPEIDALNNFKSSINFQDVARNFVPEAEKLYSWWSYRNRDWKKSNRGRRLDHIWVTKPLLNNVKNFHILKEARDWEKPSDHVPVIIELAA